MWSNGAPAEISCRLLLVRHATAAGNGRFQGQRDVSLTTAGRQEVRLLVEKCSSHPVRAVYSSDLERARHTACAVALRAMAGTLVGAGSEAVPGTRSSVDGAFPAPADPRCRAFPRVQEAGRSGGAGRRGSESGPLRSRGHPRRRDSSHLGKSPGLAAAKSVSTGTGSRCPQRNRLF